MHRRIFIKNKSKYQNCSPGPKSIKHLSILFSFSNEHDTISIAGQKFYSYIFHPLTYEMDEVKVRALIDNSLTCRQKVHFKCYNTVMFDNSNSNVAWVTQDGVVKRYWGGVQDKPNGKGRGKSIHFFYTSHQLIATSAQVLKRCSKF